MLKVLEEISVVDKISLTAIASGATNTIVGSIGWVNENMLSMSAAATFVLTITMIFSYIIGETRKNRSHRIETIKQELEIEKLRRELEVTKHPKIHIVREAPEAK